MNRTTIYVYLEDEGVDVWRPVEALLVSGNRYRIVSDNPDPEDEHWQFGTNEIVHCERRTLSNGEVLVAASPADPES